MMTCDRGFLHSFSVWTVPVYLLRIRGELAIGVHLRATDLYTVGSFDPDHDAVMRIGGEAPGGGPILPVGIKCHVRILCVEHYHAYTGQFIIGAVFKKGTRRDPDFFLGLLSGPP